MHRERKFVKPIIKKLDKEHWQMLHELCMSVYLEGNCYEFAIAVSRGTGAQIVGVMQGDVVRHAGVEDEFGRFIDSRGVVRKNSEIGKPFGLKPPYNKKTVSESDLRKVRLVSEIGIQQASLMAEALWPQWPWKIHCFSSRVVTFLDELHDLCRIHRVWIRAPVPTAKIVIDEMQGDEGFCVEPTLTGQFFFDRYLKQR